jgi:hypothetical protein
MGLVDNLRTKSAELAGQAMQRLFEDEKRAQQIASLIGFVQRGKKVLDGAQESALKGLGVASSGDMKAAGKRLAQLRKSARALDQKLGQLQHKLGSNPADEKEAGA